MSTGRRLPSECPLAAHLDATAEALQGLAATLTLVAPFLTPRDLDRCRARIAVWRQAASDQVTRLDRLDQTLARYTADVRDAARSARLA